MGSRPLAYLVFSCRVTFVTTGLSFSGAFSNLIGRPGSVPCDATSTCMSVCRRRRCCHAGLCEGVGGRVRLRLVYLALSRHPFTSLRVTGVKGTASCLVQALICLGTRLGGRHGGI